MTIKLTIYFLIPRVNTTNTDTTYFVYISEHFQHTT